MGADQSFILLPRNFKRKRTTKHALDLECFATITKEGNSENSSFRAILRLNWVCIQAGVFDQATN